MHQEAYIRPVSLYFYLQKIATEFILRLIFSSFIFKERLKNLEKSKNGKYENKWILYAAYLCSLSYGLCDTIHNHVVKRHSHLRHKQWRLHSV